MAVYDNRHSRRVALLKVVLPLIALAILSTVFLAADRRGSGQSVPFSTVELDRIAADPRVEGPNFTTVTDDGSALTIAASDVIPGQDGADAVAADLIAVVEYPGGSRLNLSSQTGSLDTGDGTARLQGGVSLISTAGYRLQGSAFDIDRSAATLTSRGAVEGMGPPGTLEAGQLTVQRSGDDYVLNFTGGVKLVYDPKSGDGN
ncbi:hypothetical protein ILP92_02450 [Maribius pontilimi]|uniref:Lipopolysaccharide export system protein LptC n=1 Tax=Palleronia pontilimi TaxID=1964209 RepID=A0A934MBK8_9RHOB|nr:hypothetical protein [Palleronia pontilimi]MBJ3761610.1 hypothetical protein [Palleronia pontilimi]